MQRPLLGGLHYYKLTDDPLSIIGALCPFLDLTPDGYWGITIRCFLFCKGGEKMKIAECIYENIKRHPPDCGDAVSVLGMLYGRYIECNRMDTVEIKADFDELYQRMHGMSLQEMDRIVDAVCALCRDHQRSGFADGIKVGLLLGQELKK
jgi:hypothetical protein